MFRVQIFPTSFRILLLSLSIFPFVAQAFSPSGSGHTGISNGALNGISRTVDGETLKFTERAIEEIRSANNGVDLHQFTPALHFDSEALDAGSRLLVTLKERTITSLLGSNANGRSARQALGKALHTLQDFYAHTNFEEEAGISPEFGEQILSPLPLSTATCTGTGTNAILGVGLTSGYFPGCFPPDGKCRHGIPIVCPSGISKDTDAHPFHFQARGDAIAATVRYVNAILDDSRIANNAKAIKRLMDIRPTLGMVIDDTGSMGGIINAVKSNVAAIVSSVKGTNDEPDQYLLQTFNDPSVGATLTFSDSAPYLSAVNSVFAHDGDDCPELAWTGSLLAVNAALTDSKLYLFTDASAKDSGLVGNVIASAKRKRTQITPLLFGSCSPHDPAYFKVAQATGGQVFILNRSEAGTIFNLVTPLIRNNVHAIFMVRTTLVGSTVGYDIPIDDTVSEATFSISMPNKGVITLKRPDGNVVQTGSPNTTVTELAAGRVYTVKTPEVGTWRLEVTGNSDLSVAVDGITPLFLNSFQFVEMKGRLAHEGLFPLDGTPVVGREVTGRANLVGSYATANFALRNPDGSTLSAIPMVQHAETGETEFIGKLTPPAGSFLAYVTGVTSAGKTYQRLLPGEILASTLEVKSPADITGSLAAGGTTELAFKVTNYGPRASFIYQATDDKKFINAGSSGSVTLDTNASVLVVVKITPPATTPEYTDVSVSLNVTQTDNTEVSNSSTLDLLVLTIDNQPPVCAAAKPSTVSIWPPNHQFVDIGILGVTDTDGDSASIVIDTITQDEATNGLGDGDSAPDGKGIGSSTASLRAERSGTGDGRVYHVGFTASDGRGGSCHGVVRVDVPHAIKEAAVDNNQSFDSTTVTP